MSSNYRFEHVKNLIDSQEYIMSLMNFKKVGNIYMGVCPFHDERSPSFALYPRGFVKGGEAQEHASFYCFGCGATGDIFEFRKRWEKLSNKWDSLKAFEEELQIVVDEELIQSHLKDQIDKIKKSNDQILSLSEINLICSSMCRNHLIWVKDNYPQEYQKEIEVIDKYFVYFDRFFSENNSKDAMKLIDDVQNKINKRQNNFLCI